MSTGESPTKPKRRRSKISSKSISQRISPSQQTSINTPIYKDKTRMSFGTVASMQPNKVNRRTKLGERKQRTSTQLSMPSSVIHVNDKAVRLGIQSDSSDDCVNSGIIYSVFSLKGRRANMEDADFQKTGFVGRYSALFGVYDGHSGSACAEYISRSIPDKLSNMLTEEMDIDVEDIILDSYRETDKEWLLNAQKHEPQLTDGSTAITVLIKDGHIFTANTGDSRAVLYKGGSYEELSKDQKPENPEEIERIQSQGGSVIGGRVQGKIAVARAFGDIEFKDMDTLSGKYITCEPEITIQEFTEDTEFIVIACDGVWDVLSSSEVGAFVRDELSKDGDMMYNAAERLVNEAYDLDSGDNITAIVVFFSKKGKKNLLKQAKKYKKLMFSREKSSNTVSSYSSESSEEDIRKPIVNKKFRNRSRTGTKHKKHGSSSPSTSSRSSVDKSSDEKKRVRFKSPFRSKTEKHSDDKKKLFRTKRKSEMNPPGFLNIPESTSTTE
eukprot:TRINITY_DN1303_c0_g1_i1.p1 TRINITY_DN1303_c0_g1~~TRINITY_DN1303_c0_g1_i1.p1  ORF type:complete len:497 (+),score=91.32 TRINITY_DN1303_c0_g1_i1:44-1534(+)